MWVHQKVQIRGDNFTDNRPLPPYYGKSKAAKYLLPLFLILASFSPRCLIHGVAEIERTLKKVTEGLEIFHETLEKLESATSAAQKEKIEVELKKEIKKLQRLRDLIKGWQALSELKDKAPINEARRLIELEMERFKVLEKEMKIKAYSKEGLSQAAKLDPREQEKLNAAHWINHAVDKLGTQTDALEAELEALQIQSRKSRRLDGDRQERLEVLPEMIDRHKMHVRKLEQLLRLMENDKVGPDEVNGIKDDVEYYVEANQEPDFVPDEDLYEQFELADESSEGEEDEEEKEEAIEGEGEEEKEKREESALSPVWGGGKTGVESGLGPSQSQAPGGSPPTSETGIVAVAIASANKDQVTPRRKSSITTSSPPVTSATNIGKSKGLSTTNTARTVATGTATTTMVTTGNVASPAISMPVVLPPAQALPVLAPSVASPPVSKVTGPSFASAILGALGGVGGSGKGGVTASTATTTTTTAAATTGVSRSQSPPSARGTGPTTFSSAAAAALSPSMPMTAGGGPPGMHNASDASIVMTSSLPLLSPIAVPGPYEEFYAVLMKRKSESQSGKGAATNPASRSARDLMPALEVSWQFCPDGSETERSRTFTPKQPFSVPSYYPNSPPAILENPSIFERFELDTLFFIFYYQQRTYAQYFAARELKRQSWRFHKKYLTWFQRHEEPKTITEEFEQGTYIYFDYEGNWCQRKKSEFTFEYRYLEDEETI